MRTSVALPFSALTVLKFKPSASHCSWSRLSDDTFTERPQSGWTALNTTGSISQSPWAQIRYRLTLRTSLTFHFCLAILLIFLFESSYQIQFRNTEQIGQLWLIQTAVHLGHFSVWQSLSEVFQHKLMAFKIWHCPELAYLYIYCFFFWDTCLGEQLASILTTSMLAGELYCF